MPGTEWLLEAYPGSKNHTLNGLGDQSPQILGIWTFWDWVCYSTRNIFEQRALSQRTQPSCDGRGSKLPLDEGPLDDVVQRQHDLWGRRPHGPKYHDVGLNVWALVAKRQKMGTYGFQIRGPHYGPMV